MRQRMISSSYYVLIMSTKRERDYRVMWNYFGSDDQWFAMNNLEYLAYKSSEFFLISYPLLLCFPLTFPSPFRSFPCFFIPISSWIVTKFFPSDLNFITSGTLQ